MSEQRKSDMIELTGLWENTSASGKRYLSGYLGNARVLIFENAYKEPGSNQPDYRLFVAPKQQQETEAPPSDDIPF